MANKEILDVCCGSKMFWFDKNNEHAIFMDIRELNTTLCDGREFEIKPDIVGDFRDIPFADNSFRVVIFDPPHLINAGDKSWLAKKYGTLSDLWKYDLSKGFSECIRVLKEYGVLIFKWNEDQIKTSEVLDLIAYKPVIGDKRSKTRWLIFIKGVS